MEENGIVLSVDAQLNVVYGKFVKLVWTSLDAQ